MSLQIEARLREILKGKVGINANVEEIGLEDDLADWGLNSSGTLKLIVGIEEAFGFEFSDEDFDSKNFKSLKSLLNYIESKI